MKVSDESPPKSAVTRVRIQPPDSLSTASYRFLSNSSNVSPWVAQPGIDGTSAQKPPSSASWTTTLIFIVHILTRNPGFDSKISCARRYPRSDSSRSKKSGKVFATHPGLRIRRPGSFSPAIAKLIAMRWSS